MRAPVPAIIASVALCGCSEGNLPDDELHPVRANVVARVVSAEEALQGAHIPSLDPHTMNDAEISKALGRGPYCTFRYTIAGRPVLAIKPRNAHAQATGVVKLNGQLVTLHSQPSPGELVMAADDVQLRMTFVDREQAGEPPPEQLRTADLLFQIDQRLRVGYRGYYVCAG